MLHTNNLEQGYPQQMKTPNLTLFNSIDLVFGLLIRVIKNLRKLPSIAEKLVY